MNYFTNCKTPEKAKMLYKKLAKKLHPDMSGGSKEAFQEMETQYREFLAISLKKKQKQYTNSVDFGNYLESFFRDNPELMQLVIKSVAGSGAVKDFIKKNSTLIGTGIGIYNILKQE